MFTSFDCINGTATFRPRIWSLLEDGPCFNEYIQDVCNRISANKCFVEGKTNVEGNSVHFGTQTCNVVFNISYKIGQQDSIDYVVNYLTIRQQGRVV